MFAASKTAAVSGGYQISRSLRFNSADSAYLGRTPASAGNRKTWTWSVWIKRGKIVADADWRLLESRPDAGTYFIFDIPNTGSATYPNTLRIIDNTGTSVQTTPIYRDPSAWYHIVLAVDTTQATASNRLKIYVNNVQVTSFINATYPAQNIDTQINTTNEQVIGRDPLGGGSSYYDGLMTETYLIDGQQLTPSSFGETNAQTGVWQPKAYSGSYGTNGFYLNFSDNSNTTAATLGADYSGNGNNWTPYNFSVTAGSGNDSLVDTPTSYGTDTGAGGTVRGNYATWNPLGASTYINYFNGNLDTFGNTAADNGCTVSTIGVSSGKWYWEETIGVVSTYPRVGAMQNPAVNGTYPGFASLSAGYVANGVIQKNGSTVTTVATFTTNDVIGMALDLDNLTLAFYKNNTLQYTVTALTAGTYFAATAQYNSTTSSVNFGQRPFAYTAPSGFKALCTQNLPTPTIGATTATQAGKYFNTLLWTSNSTVQSITGAGFQPDLVWVKSRTSNSTNEGFHHLKDAVRGTAAGVIATNSALSPFWAGTNYSITAFNSDGFSSGIFDGLNGNTMVTWLWKANGSGSSNTAGSITSTVSANTTSGFSIVTYTGNGSNATVGHGIGIAPSMVIIKQLDINRDWPVYFSSIGATKFLTIDNVDAEQTAATFWNSTAPTSTVFSLGTDGALNQSSAPYVAYCFAPVAGFSAFGSYVGNGSANGPFVFTGMRPAFILVKASSGGSAGSANWLILDSTRDPYNVAYNKLAANAATAENTGTIGSSTENNYDLLSNGFKARTTNGSSNENGTTYIYMAFASNPFKYSLAR